MESAAYTERLQHELNERTFSILQPKLKKKRKKKEKRRLLKYKVQVRWLLGSYPQASLSQPLALRIMC